MLPIDVYIPGLGIDRITNLQPPPLHWTQAKMLKDRDAPDRHPRSFTGG